MNLYTVRDAVTGNYLGKVDADDTETAWSRAAARFSNNRVRVEMFRENYRSCNL